MIRADALRRGLIEVVATIDTELGWVRDVSGQAGENVSDMTHTWSSIELAARREGQALTLGTLQDNPDLIAEHRIYITQMANIVASQREAREAAARVLKLAEEYLRSHAATAGDGAP